jgi:hypothetical protein
MYLQKKMIIDRINWSIRVRSSVRVKFKVRVRFRVFYGLRLGLRLSWQSNIITQEIHILIRQLSQ